MYVLERIRDAAAARPEKLAVVFNGAPMSYGAFWSAIGGARRTLAPHLPIEGVALLWVDSLLESWILALALRSLGVDVGGLRNLEQLADYAPMKVGLVISLASDRTRLVESLGVRRLILRDVAAAGAPGGEGTPLAPPERSGAQILLSSGTTGRPKKVRSTFGADAGPVLARRDRYAGHGDAVAPIDAEAVVNVFNMTLWGSAATRLAMTAWGVGAAVVFEQTPQLFRALAWPGLTHTLATPWYLSRLFELDEGVFARRPEMQLIVNAGAMSPAMAAEARRRLTPRLLIDIGSTEIGVWGGALVRSDEDLRWQAPVNGRVVQVVDEADQPAPIGQFGLVRVSRLPGDAEGYVGDPEATQRFFRDGWFYPGDLGVMDGQGRLSLQGRSADTVQVLGQKLPSEPWETALRDRLGCEAVCLITGAFSGQGDEMHVFVESRRPIPAAELAEAVRSTLSGFGQFAVHPVASLPRTETGKIRRLALAERLRNGEFAVDGSRRY